MGKCFKDSPHIVERSPILHALPYFLACNNASRQKSDRVE